MYVRLDEEYRREKMQTAGSSKIW